MNSMLIVASEGFFVSIGFDHTGIEVMGHGGYGMVLSATDKGTGKRYAFKFQRLTTINFGELDVMTRFKHPNLMSIIATYRLETKSGTYIVMQMDLGIPLLKAISTMDDMTRWSVVRDVAAGLTCLHQNGYHHCDVKPENVVIVDGKAVVIDFGLLGTVSTNLCNTIHLRPPETFLSMVLRRPYIDQHKSHGYVTSTGLRKMDSWAFGCMIYTIFARKELFWTREVAMSSNQLNGIELLIKKYLLNPDDVLIALDDTVSTVIKAYLVPDAVQRANVADIFSMEPFTIYNWSIPTYNTVSKYAEYIPSGMTSPMYRLAIHDAVNVLIDDMLPTRAIFTFYDLLYRIYPHVGNDLVFVYVCAFIAYSLNTEYDMYAYKVFTKYANVDELYHIAMRMVNIITIDRREPLSMRTVYDDAYSAKCVTSLLQRIRTSEFRSMSADTRSSLVASMELVEDIDDFRNRKPKDDVKILTFHNPRPYVNDDWEDDENVWSFSRSYTKLHHKVNILIGQPKVDAISTYMTYVMTNIDTINSSNLWKVIVKEDMYCIQRYILDTNIQSLHSTMISMKDIICTIDGDMVLA